MLAGSGFDAQLPVDNPWWDKLVVVGGKHSVVMVLNFLSQGAVLVYFIAVFIFSIVQQYVEHSNSPGSPITFADDNHFFMSKKRKIVIFIYFLPVPFLVSLYLYYQTISIVLFLFPRDFFLNAHLLIRDYRQACSLGGSLTCQFPLY